MRALSPSCRVVALAALMSCSFPPACLADFDATTMTTVLGQVDSILDMPTLHSTLIQDGFRSGFFLNNSGVEWSSLASLMFAQIRTISTSYYHLWAGFEDGAFLGYYQPDTLYPKRYSINWQTNQNHTCAYNYTHSGWNKALNVSSSGLPPVVDPYNAARENESGNRLLPARCREAFLAKKDDGVRGGSFDGAPYDCRYRGWYFGTKAAAKSEKGKQWTGMYVDRSTNQPAFALCAPLMNLTAYAPNYNGVLKADSRGLIGVTCTGLYIEAISTQLLALNSDISTKGSFIVERSTGLLVAASVPDVGDYYDASSFSRVAASQSNSDIIRFVSAKLAAVEWPDSLTTVAWVDDDDGAASSSDADLSFSSLVPGDAYFVSTKVLHDTGLTWDVVVVQKVSCEEGEYVDTESFMCVQCASPQYSSGGAASTCDSCVATNPGDRGYYLSEDGSTCHVCPTGATCLGGTWLPYPKKGRWVKPGVSEDLLTKAHLECTELSNCPGAAKASGTHNEDDDDDRDSKEGQDGSLKPISSLQCFESSATFAGCIANKNEAGLYLESEGSAVCREGSMGRLCGVCTDGYYLAAGQGCLSCSGSGSVGSTLVVFLLLLAVLLALAYVYATQREWLKTQPWWGALTENGRLKILWSTVQIISSIQWSTRAVWADPFKSFANILSLSQLDFANVLPMGCVFGYNLYQQVLTSTLVPIGLFAVLRYSPLYGSKWLSAGQGIYLIQLLAFVVLPSTSLVLFKLFDCTMFPDGKAFATSDLAVECYTPTYTGYVVYSSFMLLLYPIGIPMAFFALLYPKRELIAERKGKEPLSEKLHKYRFLLEDYKPSHWHGEVVRSWMRVLLSGGVILFTSNTSSRAAYGSLFGLLFVYGQREYAPFAVPFNNALALGSQHQIFFTYVMAFVVVASPQGISQQSLGVVMLLANLVIFAMALQQQLKEAKRKARLIALRSKVEAFSKSLSGIVAVRRATKGQDVTRFVFGDWASLSQAQRQKAAADKKLNVCGVEDQDELSRFLTVAQQASSKGEVARWYWKEDEHRMSAHDSASTHGTCWVAYADSVAAQLEFFGDMLHASYDADEADDGCHHDTDSFVVDVDLNGRVTSSGLDRGKAFAADSGTKYSVDLKRMVQINAKTGYERKVVRIAEILENNDDDTKKKKQTETQARTIGGNNFSGSPLADDNDIVDGGGLAAEGGDSEPPPFPSELAQAAEPLLLMKEGQLVQIQKQREDGWAYGLVIFDPHAATSAAAVVNKENKAAGGNRSEVGRRSGGGGIELAHKRSPQQQPTIFGGGGQSSAAANPFDLSSQLVQQQQQGSRSRDESADRPPNNKAQSSVHAQDGDEDNGESGGSATAGWFPSSFTGPPGVEEMSALQDFLAGAGGNAEDALAPPKTWSRNPDPLKAQLIELDKASSEFAKIQAIFQKSLGGDNLKKLKQVVSVRRVENLALWQSYAAKKTSLFQRATHEGVSDSRLKDYEMKDDRLMFHGSAPDVIPKICQQGFNRSFCGKNAVVYGKGVYFANNSLYSNRYSFSDPKSAGVKRMFLCRVLVGEFCLGKNGQLVPDERDAANNLLYDSTTDTLDEKRRDMFVTYHDAQAYPEYLLEYAIKEK